MSFVFRDSGAQESGLGLGIAMSRVREWSSGLLEGSMSVCMHAYIQTTPPQPNVLAGRGGGGAYIVDVWGWWVHGICEHGGMGTQCTVEPGGATTTTKKAMGPQCTVAPCCCCCCVVFFVVVVVVVLVAARCSLFKVVVVIAAAVGTV